MPSTPDFPRVLIVGCGDIGNRLGQRLLARQWRVWGIRRDTSALSAGIQAIAGDFIDPKCWQQVPSTLDYLIFAGTATERNDEGYRQAYVEGINAMVTHAESMTKPPKRLFFTSSTAVYHQHQGETVNEDSTTLPLRFNGKRMLEAENLLKHSHLPTTSVRFSGIYGPGRERLIQRARSGRGCEMDPPPITNRIHSEDCARALEHLMMLDQQGESIDDTYIASDHCPSSLDEVLGWLANELGVSLQQPPLQKVEISSKRCSNQRLLDSGYQFIHPDYRSGYGALIAPPSNND